MASIQNATPHDPTLQPHSDAPNQSISQQSANIVPISQKPEGSASDTSQRPAASSPDALELTGASIPRPPQQVATPAPSDSLDREPAAPIPNTSQRPSPSILSVSASQKPGTLVSKLTSPPYTAILGNDHTVFDKHPVHWHPRGDVLVQTGRMRVWVHQAYLDTHSTWFQRAFHQIDCLDPSCAHLQASESAGSPLPNVIVKVANVEGVPLVFIDAAQTTGVPSATDFALLLDILYQGFRFTCNPLTFNELVSLYNTATYYCFPHVIAVVKEHIEGIFPSDFSSLDKQPIGDAPEAALTIGTKYGISSIRRRAYYDLARAPDTQWPLILASDVFVTIPILGGIHPTSRTTTITVRADPLTSTGQRRVNALQRRLLSAWHKIHTELRPLTCPVPACDCGLRHRFAISDRVTDVMFEHPYDPIHGMRILSVDESIARVLCNAAQASVKRLLEKGERFIIRALENEWIGLV